MEFLGIDVGGTGIKGAIVDVRTGELVTERYRLLTPKPATQPAVIETIEAVISHFDWHGPVGCGFPAAVKDEIVKTASKIDNSWIGVNASAQIEKETGCPTHLVNDADAAGYAEVEFGAGRNINGTIFMAAFGTGIGTAVFHNQQLVPNTELGHIPLHGMDAEDYAANSIREKNNLSWEEWGGRVNEYLQLIVDLFWPDIIIVGGGVSKSFHEFKPYIDVDSKVVAAESRNHAGIIGAALAASAKHRYLHKVE
ncbi:polyphosphate--glucose phosphotransferase [Rhodohalobacter sulfatireducens]|uniref:ROK family protein n=1 Tax=Rhodohalobacter sulfatireducens TaxID=2911366 RepID=A0ABS9KJB0_9BACT|nr:ROK family protein [Rhodohalobacter sulfatireducens]MCG2590949.1 ROK family protein [Rhodohalobacter sulfatireducens]MDR9363695.1 ROK family protein [Balneolaceae bacterium]MDR9409536.1 ROK family protein [Balneolaceae bacterium]